MHPEPSVQALFGEYPYTRIVAEIRDFAIFITDTDGRILSWNEGARLLFGYDNTEIVGQLFHILFVPEDHQAGVPEREMATACTHGHADDNRWHLKKDGSRFWTNGILTALRDESGDIKGFVKVARDDTSRKQNEDALRISQERFDLVARATNDAIWDWDLETQTIWWNNNMLTLFGYAPEDVNHSPEWWKERVHPDDRDRVVQSIQGVIAGEGATWRCEYRFQRADGSYAPVFDRGYVMRDEAGKARRLLGTMLDMTLPRELEQQRQIFKRLADNSPDFVGLCDLDGQLLYLNQAALDLVGLPDMEAARQISVGDFYFPEDRQFILDEFFPKVIREGQAITELRFRHFQTGSPIWMMYLVFVVRGDSGQPVALATVSRDITAQRASQAEREELLHRLEVERGRLAEIFETSPAFASLFRGPQFVYELTNPAYYRLIGNRAIIGKPAIEALPEIADQGFIERLRSVYETGQPFEGHEVSAKLQREPGAPLEERFVSLRYQPLREADGTISGVFSHGFDITEQVRARQAVEESRREAESARQQAEAAREQAEDANRLKDEFLATLSHELRTPLNSILGWSSLLQNENISSEDAKRGLASIERNARAQAQLIEDILDVSRMVTGKMRLDVQPVDLGSIIEDAIATVLPATQAKQIRLQRVIDAGANMVSGDPARLQQIVWNLLSNAIKFTPKGGRVQVRLERVNSHIEIVVADTGVGIAPEMLPHIFDRFRQADSSSTRAHGGLGLGLAIVRHLAELHGGSIEADSQGLGQGAIFTLKLPLAAVRPHEASSNDTAPDPHPTTSLTAPETTDFPSLDGLHILVVDDQEDTLHFLSTALEKCGALVSTASSAAEALATLQQQLPNVLLSDIGMPGEDGYTLIKQVRALPPAQGGHTPAAALTAFARMEDRIQALRAGFQTHISKPVEPLELVTVIANLAGRHNAT